MRGTCRWPGPFWSIGQEPFAWPLSILTSHAALIRPSLLHGSTNSNAKRLLCQHKRKKDKGTLKGGRYLTGDVNKNMLSFYEKDEGDGPAALRQRGTAPDCIVMSFRGEIYA